MGLMDRRDRLDTPLDDSQIQRILTEEVQKAGLVIDNFQLRFEHGLATISGSAMTFQDMELAHLIVSNNQRVRRVNDSALTVITTH